MDGRVVAIYIAKAAGVPTEPVEEARAFPGRGLEGDRYFAAEGTFSGDRKPGRDVTLIEREAIDAIAHEYDIQIELSDSRRNVVTEGVALNHLVGREFTVGDVRMRGVRLCEPCGHLEELNGKPGLRRALVHRGGLRADILTEGALRPGAEIRAD